MPDPIYPGAIQIAGALRGYRAGRIPQLLVGLRHYTVGVNSIGTCGRDFQMLQARNGVLYQGAEVDAVNWGAGDPWNGRAVHVEAEWHPVYNGGEPILNPAMIATLAGFIAWLEHEWGVPRARSYEGPDRIPDWWGWIDHRWLIQSGDWHYNYWPPEDWPALSGASPTQENPDMERLVRNTQQADPNLAWFWFPPLSAPAQQVTEATMFSIAATGVPRFETTGPPIVAADSLRQGVRSAFVASVAAAGGGGGVPANVATKADVAAARDATIAAVNTPKGVTLAGKVG